MAAPATSVRYSLLVGAIAALCALLYVQFGHHLPDALQGSNSHSLRQQYPNCALTEVPRNNLFAAASVWEGGAQSGLVLGGVQWPTKIVAVHVSPGDKPITAFLSGYGVIFSFSGAVDRIQRVVAMSQFMNKMVGVAGPRPATVRWPSVPPLSRVQESRPSRRGACRIGVPESTTAA